MTHIQTGLKYIISSTKEFIHQREQKENLKNEFLERIDTKKDRQSIKRNLINILQKMDGF